MPQCYSLKHIFLNPNNQMFGNSQGFGIMTQDQCSLKAISEMQLRLPRHCENSKCIYHIFGCFTFLHKVPKFFIVSRLVKGLIQMLLGAAHYFS